MLSQVTGLQGMSEITQSKAFQGMWKGGTTNSVLSCGGNCLLRAKYGRKSQNDLYAKRRSNKWRSNKIAIFLGYLITFRNPCII